MSSEQQEQMIAEYKLMLSELRAGNFTYFLVPVIRDQVARGEFTLEHIETTEEELDRLWLENTKLKGNKLVIELRTGTNKYLHHLVGEIQKVMKDGDFGVEEIGTSEEELSAWAMQGLKDLARELLDELRKENQPYSDKSQRYRELIIDNCSSVGVGIEELGLTPQDNELIALRSNADQVEEEMYIE